jgi:hypothetical protein
VTDYVHSGLVKRRAELAGEAEAIRARLAAIAADLGHLDAVIRMFDPEFDLAAIRPKRARPDGAAGRGEMSRAVLDVLRSAAEPMTTAAVTAAVMAAKGMDTGDRRAALRMSDSVGLALRRQERNGAVKGTREPGGLVRWEVVSWEPEPQTGSAGNDSAAAGSKNQS